MKTPALTWTLDDLLTKIWTSKESSAYLESLLDYFREEKEPRKFEYLLRLIAEWWCGNVSSTDLVHQCSTLLRRKPKLLRDVNFLLGRGDRKDEEVTIICCLDRPEVDCVVAVYADPAVKGPANRVGMIHAISPLPQSNFIKLPNYMSSAPLSCLYTSRDIENDWFWNNLHSLDGDLAPFLMELLQIRLESIAGDSKIRKRLLQGMKLLNKLHGALPPSIVVHDVTREGTHPITGGGFADIWKGRRNGQPVCLKVLRIFTSSSDRKKLFKDLSNEVLIWKQLHHRHILPLYGVNMELFQPSYCIVSPWMSNGDIGSYLDKSAATDSTFERKVKLITEIAEGLSYLHELDPPVIHGDIKGSNVLISEDFHCRLADFGLSAIETQTQSYNVTNSAQNRGSIRWLAPELMNPNSVHTTLGCSKTRDIYAFGCTVVEILTGKPPFPEYKMELHVMIQVLSGTRPPRPAECTDELWDLIERCWDESLSQRPGAGWILNILRNCSLDLGSWEEVVEVGSEGEAKIPASSLQLSSMNALFSIPSTQDPPREDQNWASPDSWACVPAAESVSPVKDATLASDSPQPVPKADVDEDYVLIRKRTVSTSISVKESGRARSIPIQTSEQNPGGAASADQSAMQTQKQKGTFNSCAPSHIPPPISPQTPTLTSLVSKHNIREGYATIASPSCPASAFSLLSNGGASLRGSILINPGLPSTSQSGSLINHGRVHDSLDGVVRRPRGPRGPSASSFTRRDSRIMPNPTWSKPTSPVPVQSSLTIPKSFDPRSLPALRPGSTTGKSSKKLGLIIPAPNHSNFESYAGPSGFTPMSSQAPEEICIRPAAAPSHANDSLSHIIEEFNTDLRLEEAKRKDGAFFSKEWNDDAFKEISLLSGAVHKVQEKKTDRIMACKMIALPIRQHEDELSTIHSANHPNIILMYGAYASPSPSSRPVKLLMEFCEGGSLEAIGKCPKEKGAVLEETVAGRIAEGVLQGLDYLHSMRMTHRDIKPSNILLTRQGVVKLCDIAVSGELIESFAGISTDTSLYMSPERISGHEYNICSDVWSAGISLLELVQQRFPFPNDVPPIETMMYITSQDPPTLQDSGNQQWSDEMKDFIRQTLIHDAISRPYPRDMLKHTWIVGSMMQVVDMAKWIEYVWNWSSPGSGRVQRTHSCHSCRKCKVRCDVVQDSVPPHCQRCKRLNLDCTFSLPEPSFKGKERMSNVRSSHHNSFPGNEFLTSPFMDTPYDEFLSPNNFDSPVSPDFNTPLMADLSSFEMHSDFNDAPLFDDLATSIYGDYGALTTETAKEVEPIKEHAQPAASASTYTFSPGTPMLDAVDAVDPSSLCHSLRIPKSKEFFPTSTSSARKTHSSATGTRKHITTASLVPLDAPTQSRHYATPSTTSRKEVPAVFARKRNRSLAFGDEKDEPEVKRDIDVESTTEKDHDVNASKPTIPPFIRSFRAQLDLDGEESDGDEIVYPRGQVIRPQAANSRGHVHLSRYASLVQTNSIHAAVASSFPASPAPFEAYLSLPEKERDQSEPTRTGTEQMVLDEILDQEHYLSQVVEEGDEQELHSSLSSQAQQSSFIPTGRRRAQIACRNCRRRKVKCVTNEEPPHDPCERCTRMSLVCEYVAVGEPLAVGEPSPPPTPTPVSGSSEESLETLSEASSVDEGVIELLRAVSRSFSHIISPASTSSAVTVLPNALTHVTVGGTSVPLVVSKRNVATGRTAKASHNQRGQETTFVCPVPGCGTTFTRSFDLKNHIRSHNEEKSFKCHWPDCNMGFVRQHDCKRHEQRVHINHPSFTCEGCQESFARIDALIRHLESEAGTQCHKVWETSDSAGSAGTENEGNTGEKRRSNRSSAMPETEDESDVPISISPSSQILRRAARSKIPRPVLPGDGGTHRFGPARMESECYRLSSDAWWNDDRLANAWKGYRLRQGITQAVS